MSASIAIPRIYISATFSFVKMTLALMRLEVLYYCRSVFSWLIVRPTLRNLFPYVEFSSWANLSIISLTGCLIVSVGAGVLVGTVV